jgi:hypothetical protein
MLRPAPFRILINDIDANTIVANADTTSPLTIAGITIPKGSVINPTVTTGTTGTAKKITVTVSLAGVTASAIQEFPMRIEQKVDGSNDLSNIRPTRKEVVCIVPPAVTATADLIVASIVSQINADPTFNMIAVDATGGVYTLELKDASRDFDVFFPSGMATKVVTTAYVKPKLQFKDMAQLFPLRHGFEGNQPADVLPIKGVVYEKIGFHFSTPMQMLSLGFDRTTDVTEVEIYVNKSDAQYQTGFVDKIAGTHATVLATAKADITGNISKPDNTAAFTSVGGGQITANP